MVARYDLIMNLRFSALCQLLNSSCVLACIPTDTSLRSLLLLFLTSFISGLMRKTGGNGGRPRFTTRRYQGLSNHTALSFLSSFCSSYILKNNGGKKMLACFVLMSEYIEFNIDVTHFQCYNKDCTFLL